MDRRGHHRVLRRRCTCTAPGLSTREEYLDILSGNIEELQTTPGRLVQSAEQASFDAWIKYYRPDENSANTSISYYTKGAVVGFLLDAKIRKATSGARGLDDVMRRRTSATPVRAATRRQISAPSRRTWPGQA